MAAPDSSTQLTLLEPDPRGPAPSRPPRDERAARAARPAQAQREAISLGDARQPELPFRRLVDTIDEAVRAGLEVRLRHAVGAPVALTLTDNRRTMVSIQRRGSQRSVRLHHMFADAPPEVVEALGRYLGRGDRFASKLIDRYIAANQHRIRNGSAPGAGAPRLRPHGRVYDLDEIQRELSARYFRSEIDIAITWGRQASTQGRRRGRRTIRMGTYFIDEQLIRIHPALDQAFVPRYFVEWVVYHEMLHHVVPMPVVDGRKIYHSPEFRERERQFDEYELARGWEQAYLHRLIASRNRAGDVED